MALAGLVRIKLAKSHSNRCPVPTYPLLGADLQQCPFAIAYIILQTSMKQKVCAVTTQIDQRGSYTWLLCWS